MSLEAELKANTDALTAHTVALENFMKLGTKAGGQATDDKPTRTRRTSAEVEADKEKAKVEPEKAKAEPEKAKDDVPGIYDIVKKFLDYGKEDDRDDEDEREKRAKFVKKMLGYFDVERARDIPEKNVTKVKRWCKLFADGEKVDFEVD